MSIYITQIIYTYIFKAICMHDSKHLLYLATMDRAAAVVKPLTRGGARKILRKPRRRTNKRT